MVEEGKLTLETPVSTYFPNFMPDFSKDITIQHLLNNSSGMEANIGRTDDNGNGLIPEETAITFNEVLEKLHMDKFRVYVAVNNLYTFTKYSGYNPDVSNASPLGAGVDLGQYPQTRTFTTGVNISF